MDINTLIITAVVAYTIWYIFYLVNRDIKNTKRINALEKDLQQTKKLNSVTMYLLWKAGSLGDYEAELEKLTNMGDRG